AAGSASLAAPRMRCVRKRTCRSSIQSPTLSRVSSFLVAAVPILVMIFSPRHDLSNGGRFQLGEFTPAVSNRTRRIRRAGIYRGSAGDLDRAATTLRRG